MNVVPPYNMMMLFGAGGLIPFCKYSTVTTRNNDPDQNRPKRLRAMNNAAQAAVRIPVAISMCISSPLLL
jgi:hypothetical protein